jgi:hypothetical protein
MITSASTRKRRANRQTRFGPTCRLVSSPEVVLGATVGTLKQGYPLLQCEDAAISRRVVNSTRSHHVDGSGATTWPEKMIYSKVSAVGPDPPRESAGPLYVRTGPPGKVQDLHGREPNP